MTVSRQRRAALWERDGRACHYCTASLTYEALTLDHIVPKAFGGPNTFWNMVCACFECNHRWASTIRKCECGVCSRALEQFLRESGQHPPVRATRLQVGLPKSLPRLRSRSLSDAIEDLEARHQSLTEVLAVIPDSDMHTHHAAAMRGKLNGLREALEVLSAVSDIQEATA